MFTAIDVYYLFVIGAIDWARYLILRAFPVYDAVQVQSLQQRHMIIVIFQSRIFDRSTEFVDFVGWVYSNPRIYISLARFDT